MENHVKLFYWKGLKILSNLNYAGKVDLNPGVCGEDSGVMAEDHKVSPPKPENLHKSPKASEVALIFQNVWTSDWPIASSDCLIFCDFL